MLATRIGGERSSSIGTSSILATRIGGLRNSNIPVSGSSFSEQPAFSGGLQKNWGEQLRYSAGQTMGDLVRVRGWGGQPAPSTQVPARQAAPRDSTYTSAYTAAYRMNRGEPATLTAPRSAVPTPGLTTKESWAAPDATLTPFSDDLLGSKLAGLREDSMSSVSNLSLLAKTGFGDAKGVDYLAKFDMFPF